MEKLIQIHNMLADEARENERLTAIVVSLGELIAEIDEDRAIARLKGE